MALVVTADGSICSVMQPHGQADGKESVSELWPGDVGQHVRSNVRRVLRNREFFCDYVQHDEEGRSAEHIYIAQGRDRVLLIVRDTSRRQRDMSRLEKLAYVDEATGLPNRELFNNSLEKVCEHQRLREGRAAVICIHVDDVDDDQGRVSIDRYNAVLQELAQRMLRELRGANSMDENDYERRTVIARIDFRRFGIILPFIETGTDAEAVTERLVQLLQQPVDVGDKAIGTRVYAGISLFPQDGGEAETLFTNGLAATEEARTGQPGNTCFHSGTVKLRTLQRQDLEVELKTALERGSFSLNYLPIVDAAGHTVRSIEALLRWPDSVMGSHSTSKIIGLAERTGLIVPIGEWVLRHSFGQLRAWHDAGWPELRLAVNLSMQEFSRPDIAARLAALMLEAGVQPEHVDLEITEKMLARDAMASFPVLDALKALGIGLYVDDYGTAACSLAQISHSPVDGIKLDNSLVSAAERCAEDHAACHAGIAAGHALGLTVVAEGVESAERADTMREAGCDLLQGFYFTKPLDTKEMQLYLESAPGGEDDG
jgi:EAL domain-containing protein (putative c-di-GMP-specific phosphodiesterase class I)/GGDEF domain-containing protein